MKRMHRYKYGNITGLVLSLFASTVFAETRIITTPAYAWLHPRPGFMRFTYDNLSMPNNIENMGLLGVTYYTDFTPEIYGGIGGYGSITGNQGGLFVLGFGGGVHKLIAPRIWGDAGLFLGGGGGRSSLVGGGLMVRPYVGLQYDLDWGRLGIHYSYINFPSGQIKSKQIGADLDVPFDFYYVRYPCLKDCCPYWFRHLNLFGCNYLDFQRNDFSVLLQAYVQNPNTRNVLGQIQNGTIRLIGAELDHYMTDEIFWFLKAAGAYAGVPNGYMDVLGGLGYHWVPGFYQLAIVPQLGVGAGGGGNVDTGGGVLIHPQLGAELPLTTHFSARISGGYLYSPKGEMRAITATAYLIYHLDIATVGHHATTHIANCYQGQGWRLHLFNQTYLHPQRADLKTREPLNSIVFQIDQLFTPLFFFSYQAAFAYQGEHAGGYASGMVGPGIQTPAFFDERLQLYTQVLMGTGGGGNLAIGGGALVEPIVGAHYALTEAIGLHASVSEVKSIHHELNTPAVNVGVTVRFGTFNRH